MDRKGQLRNVSFGGAWSEQISGDEALAEAMTRVEAAVLDTSEVDLRADADLARALDRVAATHPKGTMLKAAWSKALGLPLAGQRHAELARIAQTLRAGLVNRLKNFN